MAGDGIQGPARPWAAAGPCMPSPAMNAPYHLFHPAQLGPQFIHGMIVNRILRQNPVIFLSAKKLKLAAQGPRRLGLSAPEIRLTVVNLDDSGESIRIFRALVAANPFDAGKAQRVAAGMTRGGLNLIEGD